MSIPSSDAGAKQSADVSSFYGRSYPRASIMLDGNNEVRKDRKMAPPAANTYLIDWAKKADWNMGGAKGDHKRIDFPRPAFTPVYAFLARKRLHLKQLHPYLSNTDTLVLAKLNAAAEWEGLTEEEQDLYIQLAEQDAVRYEREVAAFEEEHPGLMASHKHRNRALKAATKPKQPLTAFRAFLLSSLPDGNAKELKDARPEAAAEWSRMTDDQKAPYEEQAEEDLKRWEKELDSFPEYKAKIEARLQERQKKQQEHAAKRQIFRAAKKRATRPGKMGLPKPKPIVKNGKLTRKAKGSAPKKDAPVTRSSKRQKKASKKEEDFGSEPETEEEDVAMSASESGDEIDNEPEADSETESKGGQESNDEDDEGAGSSQDESEDQAADEDTDDGEVEISDAEDDQLPGRRVQALAAEAEVEDEDDVEEDEDMLRAAQTPSDLLVDPTTKDGLFGWAKSALMNGIKGVWGRNQRPSEAAPSSENPQEEARGEALIGRSFVKFFDGKPYTGQVKKYIAKYKWYYVEYEDGDNEELVEADMLMLLAEAAKQAKHKGMPTNAKNKRKKAMA